MKYMVIDYLRNYYDDVLTMFFEHAFLTVASLGIALGFALPFGYLLSRTKLMAVPSLAVLGIIYAIPSLALFALLIPFLGLGMKAAVTGLVAYSQLILVRNVMVGFQSVDRAVLEAARGMGLSGWRLLWKIQLPLALPVIIGGIRVATVSIIGIGTIAAWINAGGLGGLLFEGLYQNAAHKMMIGTVLVSLLAIVTNHALLWLEKRAGSKAKGER